MCLPLTQTFSIKIGFRIVISEILFFSLFFLLLANWKRLNIRFDNALPYFMFIIFLTISVLMSTINYFELSREMDYVTINQTGGAFFLIFVECYRGIAVAGIILSMAVYLKTFDNALRISKIFVLSSVITAIYGIYYYFAKNYGLPFLPGTYIGPTMRSSSFFWEPNTYANYMLISMGFAIVYLSKLNRSKWDWLVIMLLLLGGFFSFSAVFLGVGWVVLLYAAFSSKSKRILAFVSIFIVALVGVYLQYKETIDLAARVMVLSKFSMFTGGYKHVSAVERAAVAKEAWELIQASSWLGGYGLGSSFIHFGKLSNLFLEFWFDGSIIGLLFIAFALAYPFFKCVLIPGGRPFALIPILMTISALSFGFKFGLFYYFFFCWSMNISNFKNEIISDSNRLKT